MYDQQMERMARLRKIFAGQDGFVTAMVVGVVALMLLLAFSYSYAAKRNVENAQGSGAGEKAQKAAEAGIYYALQDAKVKFKAIEESGELAELKIIETQGQTYVNGKNVAAGVFSLNGELLADQDDSKIRVKYVSQGEYKGAIRRVQGIIAYSKPVSLTHFFQNGVRFNSISNTMIDQAWTLPASATGSVKVNWRKDSRSFLSWLIGLTDYDQYDSAMAVFGPRLPSEFDYTFRIKLGDGDGHYPYLQGEAVAISYGTKDYDKVGNSNLYSIEYTPFFEKVDKNKMLPIDRRDVRGSNDAGGGMLLVKKQVSDRFDLKGVLNFLVRHDCNETRNTYAAFKDNASGDFRSITNDITAIPLDADSGMRFTIHHIGEFLGVLDEEYAFPIIGLKQQVEAVRKKERFKFALLNQEHDFRLKVSRDEDGAYRHYVYVDGVLALHFTDYEPINFAGGRFAIRVWNTQAEIISMKGPPPEIEKWQQL